MVVKALLVGSALAAAAATVAQVPPQALAPPPDPPPLPATQTPPLDNDPMRMVCINERIPGSAWARHRVCRTRAEWDDHRRDARNTTDRVQLQSR